MTAPRCRWHVDGTGRCPDAVAAPGAPGVPELCPRHLLGLEPYARSRASQPADAAGWIAWAARRAAETEDDLKAVGLIRPARALDGGRPVIPTSPERR